MQRKTTVNIKINCFYTKKLNTKYKNHSYKENKIEKDNQVLMSKIDFINSRSNVRNFNKKAFSKQKQSKSKIRLNKKIKENENEIEKDNVDILKRMSEKSSFFSYKKLDNDYNNHLKLLKNIQKIKVKSPNRLDTTSSIESAYKISSSTIVIES